MPARRIPLAWLSLVHNRRRMAASLAGVCFAVLLMFIEMGFLNGVYDAQTGLVHVLDADLVIVNHMKEDLLPTLPFPRRRVAQTLAVPGVRDAVAVYLEEYRATYKSFGPGRQSGIHVLAYAPESAALRIPEISAQSGILQLPDVALVDEKSRDLFGALAGGVTAELNGRRLTLAGTFPLGPNYRMDGLLVMSPQNFFRYFPGTDGGTTATEYVEFGLVRLDAGADRAQVQTELQALLPDDVDVLTPAQLVDRIKQFWRQLQPIGAVFGLGAAVGFLIGVAVCYQILYTDITDNLAQYATLKAMGCHNGFLVRLVTGKAVFLSLGGFACGLLLTGVIYEALEAISRIPMTLTLPRAAGVLVLSITMCVLSGLLAVRRALALDPAELF